MPDHHVADAADKAGSWLANIPSTSAIGGSLLLTVGAFAKRFASNGKVMEKLDTFRNDMNSVKKDVQGIHDTLTQMEGERQQAKAAQQVSNAILIALAKQQGIPIPQLDING